MFRTPSETPKNKARIDFLAFLGTPKMLKWGSKMRPPFLNDLGKESRTTGQPTRESKASQIPEIPMFRALLKTRPFLP